MGENELASVEIVDLLRFCVAIVSSPTELSSLLTWIFHRFVSLRVTCISKFNVRNTQHWIFDTSFILIQNFHKLVSFKHKIAKVKRFTKWNLLYKNTCEVFHCVLSGDPTSVMFSICLTIMSVSYSGVTRSTSCRAAVLCWDSHTLKAACSLAGSRLTAAKSCRGLSVILQLQSAITCRDSAVIYYISLIYDLVKIYLSH